MFAALADFSAQATLPLISWAPAIDTLNQVRLRTDYSYVSGYHDNMPKHEIYVGTPASEYFKVYESEYNGGAQILCLYDRPGYSSALCGIKYNAQI